MAKEKTLRMKETLEYYNEETGEVVKEKHHYLNKRDDYRMNEEVFSMVCNGMEEERRKTVTKRLGGFWAKTLVERIVNEARKVVILVKSPYTFEYTQRWTYELV